VQIGTFDIYNIYGSAALALPADRNSLRRRRIWLPDVRRDWATPPTSAPGLLLLQTRVRAIRHAR
jgi:hypothetical protein